MLRDMNFVHSDDHRVDLHRGPSTDAVALRFERKMAGLVEYEQLGVHPHSSVTEGPSS